MKGEAEIEEEVVGYNSCGKADLGRHPNSFRFTVLSRANIQCNSYIITLHITYYIILHITCIFIITYMYMSRCNRVKLR